MIPIIIISILLYRYNDNNDDYKEHIDYVINKFINNEGYRSMEYTCDESSHTMTQFATEDTPELREKSVMFILSNIHIIFEKYKINYWLIGGTLLGAIRDKGFIKWDQDGDIGITDKGFEILYHNINDIDNVEHLSFELYPRGCLGINSYKNGKCKNCNKAIYCPGRIMDTRTGFYVDIFMWIHHNNKLVNKHGAWKGPKVIPQEWVFPTHTAKFGNLNLHLPNNSHNMLRAEYGKYMIPNDFYSKTKYNIRDIKDQLYRKTDIISILDNKDVDSYSKLLVEQRKKLINNPNIIYLVDKIKVYDWVKNITQTQKCYHRSYIKNENDKYNICSVVKSLLENNKKIIIKPSLGSNSKNIMIPTKYDESAILRLLDRIQENKDVDQECRQFLPGVIIQEQFSTRLELKIFVILGKIILTQITGTHNNKHISIYEPSNKPKFFNELYKIAIAIGTASTYPNIRVDFLINPETELWSFNEIELVQGTISYKGYDKRLFNAVKNVYKKEYYNINCIDDDILRNNLLYYMMEV